MSTYPFGRSSYHVENQLPLECLDMTSRILAETFVSSVFACRGLLDIEDGGQSLRLLGSPPSCSSTFIFANLVLAVDFNAAVRGQLAVALCLLLRIFRGVGLLRLASGDGSPS